jgi:hypothetical protein
MIKALILVFSSSVAIALGEPSSDQARVDRMFLFPKENSFSFATLYGSRVTYEALVSPEHIETYLISPMLDLEPTGTQTRILGHDVLAGPAPLSAAAVKSTITLLKTKGTFQDRPMCGQEPIVLLRFSKAKIHVDLLFCFKCSDVTVVRNDHLHATVDPSRPSGIQLGLTPRGAASFLKIFRSTFPHDKPLASLKHLAR